MTHPATTERISGPLLFSWYAHPPNQLGYCGPVDHRAFLEAAADGSDVRTLAHMALEFDGALPYLDLIARCNGMDDFLDYRVVEAYWIGNDLLDQVGRRAMMAMVEERFSALAGLRIHTVTAAATKGVAHHSFHVLAAYPWIGLLRSGIKEPSIQVMDGCRISWGRVVAVQGDTVLVSRRPLVFDGIALALGDEQIFPARYSVARASLIDHLVVGDLVALHWGWICDRLSRSSCVWLRRCTEANLRAVNAISTPEDLMHA